MTYRIGEVAKQLGLSLDTLRYYEKIDLVPRVTRSSGARRYSDADVSRLRFVRRAQAIGFSLNEVKLLLELRQQPARARPKVRALAQKKLAETRLRIDEMNALQHELRLLLNLCSQGACSCPIIRNLDRNPQSKTRTKSKAKTIPRPKAH